MGKKKIFTEKRSNTEDNSVYLYNNKELRKMNLLSLDKIYVEYPNVKEHLHWSKQDIHVFFESKILLGKFDPEDSTEMEDLLIDSDSLEKLMEYHQELSKQ